MNPASVGCAKPRPRGMIAIGIFLLAGALIACFAGATLVWRGTPVDRIWDLNPRAYDRLLPFGRSAGIPFIVLGAALGAAGVGWFKRRVWAWRLAVLIIVIQILGDLAYIFLGRVAEGGTGVIIAGALLFYMIERLSVQLSGTPSHKENIRRNE